MTNDELIPVLKENGYRRTTLETDKRESMTFYTHQHGLHINATKNLSFHIILQSQSFGLGRFAICATRNGESSQLGTDYPELFFRRLLLFLQGKIGEKEIIDEVTR